MQQDATERKALQGTTNCYPDNAGWQRDLSVSFDKVGDVLVAQGNLPEALRSFRDGLAISERLAKSDPGNAGWQRDLSVSHNRVGDVLVAQGDLPAALARYRRRLAISERLAEADPGNAGWQRDLSVSYERVGDVLVAQGDLRGGAEVLPRRPRDQRASGQSRPRQRRLAARPLGVLRQDRRRAGRRRATCRGAAIYRDGLAISERLAKADPGNAGWQRDLSVSTTRSATCWWPRATCAAALRLPRRPRDMRAAGQIRPRQRRLAARPLGLLQQGRRRAGRRRATWRRR